MAASPDGIDLAAGEISHDRSCSLLPIAHPLALSRAWRGRLRWPPLGRRHRTVMVHLLDINVPRSRQICVELGHDGNLWTSGRHTADPVFPPKSWQSGPKSRLFPEKQWPLRSPIAATRH